VFWVPRRSIAVEKVLEDEGVYGSLTQVRQAWKQNCKPHMHDCTRACKPDCAAVCGSQLLTCLRTRLPHCE
jgi:hypothetical protein